MQSQIQSPAPLIFMHSLSLLRVFVRGSRGNCRPLCDDFTWFAGHFEIYSKPDGVPLVAAGLKKVKDPKSSKLVERPYTCFDVYVPL